MSNQLLTKKCIKCGEEKLMILFHKDKRNKSGYHPYCKECRKPICRKYARTERARKKHNEVSKRWYENNKDFYKQLTRKNTKVHWVLNMAIKSGKIIKSTYCHICGGTEKIENHHPDYSKPLFYIPLCQKCHKTIHAYLNLLIK